MVADQRWWLDRWRWGGALLVVAGLWLSYLWRFLGLDPFSALYLLPAQFGLIPVGFALLLREPRLLRFILASALFQALPITMGLLGCTPNQAGAHLPFILLQVLVTLLSAVVYPLLVKRGAWQRVLFVLVGLYVGSYSAMIMVAGLFCSINWS